MTTLRDDLKADFKGHLTSLSKHMSEKVNRLERTLGEEIVNNRTGQQRQFDTLDGRLKQLETARAQQPPVASMLVASLANGTSISDSYLPAAETYLPQAILFVVFCN